RGGARADRRREVDVDLRLRETRGHVLADIDRRCHAQPIARLRCFDHGPAHLARWTEHADVDHSRPAPRISARSSSSSFAVTPTSGSRTSCEQRPSNDSAPLVGAGLGSANNRLFSTRSLWWSLRARSQSPAFAASHISLISRGATFDT